MGGGRGAVRLVRRARRAVADAAAARSRAGGRSRWRDLARLVQPSAAPIGVALLVLVIAGGYAGPQSGADNFAPTFILIIFWVGLVVRCRSCSATCSARSARGGRSVVRPARCSAPARRRRTPTRAAGALAGGARPARSSPGSSSSAAGTSVPRTLAGAALGYTVITLAAQAIWGTETWTRRGEGFAVYFNLFSRISVFETRDGVVGVRPPLGGLPPLDAGAGHGRVRGGDDRHGHVRRAQPGPAVGELLGRLVDALDGLGIRLDGARRSPRRRAAAGRGAGRRLLLARDRGRAVGRRRDDRAAAGDGFIHTLVPIAAVYVLAHYLTYLVFDGQAIIYLASDPFGQGWDLFGTAASGIDYSLLARTAPGTCRSRSSWSATSPR